MEKRGDAPYLWTVFVCVLPGQGKGANLLWFACSGIIPGTGNRNANSEKYMNFTAEALTLSDDRFRL